MRKVPFVAVFWTFALALPFALIAIAGVAWIDQNFSVIAEAIGSAQGFLTTSGRNWAAEFSQRMPELAGMIVGAIVMLTIYLFARKPAQMAEDSTDHDDK